MFRGKAGRGSVGETVWKVDLVDDGGCMNP